MRRLIPLFCVFSVMATTLGGCRNAIEKPPIPVPEVVVESVLVRDVQPYIEAVGKAEAYEWVEIAARVSGFLREVRYEPGDIVQAGAPLFLIEQDQYKAEVKSAQAAIATAKAHHKLALANLERTKLLIPQGAMTEQDLETDQAKVEEADASVKRAEADLAKAELNLSYTDVRSPITGKVDRNLVDVGNLVSPMGMGADSSHSLLTTVAGMDPIYVYFDISDYQFNHIRKFALENKKPAAEILIQRLEKVKEKRKEIDEAYKKTIGLDAPVQEKPAPAGSDEIEKTENLEIEFEVSTIKGAEGDTTDFPYKGIIDMAGNRIDESTGTIMVRGEVPNSDYMIFPGQICRVRIPVWPVNDAVLVKEEAICTDLNQRYVFVVDESGKAHRRVVQLGMRQTDGTRVVERGLKKGERYVVSGVQKTRDGGDVKIIPAETESPNTLKKDETKPEAEPAKTPETETKPAPVE